MASNTTPAAVVQHLDRASWTNRHENFKQKIKGRINVYNSNVNDPGRRLGIADLGATTSAIQGLIGDAAATGEQLRAIGGGWSFSRVPATGGRVLNTKNLNSVFSLSERRISEAYSGTKDGLFLVQCGTGIAELNKYLETRKGRALKTTGASNGQTIAGALSTGTHGSAFDFGAITEYVVALHLIVGPDRHVWLERASYPVIADSLPDELGAELIRDDKLFNAALVSFGSFGVIHAVVIETEEIFLLEKDRRRLPYDDALKALITTLDFSDYPLLPRPGERPYHFQIVANPFDLDSGVFAKTIYKDLPYPAGRQPDYSIAAGHGPGDDLPSFLAAITDEAPALTEKLITALLKTRFKPFKEKDRLGTIGETFGYTSTKGKVFGSTFGVDLKDAARALDLLVGLQESEGPAPLVFAQRFVKKSSALLGFTKYETTCVIDMDGVFSKRASSFLNAALAAFVRAKIPHTQHWGKINNMTADSVRGMYGRDRIDQWIAARHQLLDESARRIFSNPFLDRLRMSA